ncbi:MAG: hypothetical protein KKE53_20410, partial [Proteobacteria bacterium]|nr:hypothetical protein [Pseudomonadota bacterium]
LTVWGPGEDRSTTTNNHGHGPKIEVPKMLSSLQKSVNVSLSEQAVRSRPVKAVAESISEDQEVMADLNMRVLKTMIERLTGKPFQVISPQAVQAKNSEHDRDSGAQDIQAGNQDMASGSPSEGGLIYDYYESHYEYESTTFDASGKIITEDGQEIDFSVALNMTREFLSEEQISIRAGAALKDPLVINFSGQAAELTQTKFSFDIDNDGSRNQISFLRPGSGFLALDKNGDKLVNNGSELFGPESGNGFQDLAAYDLDGNKWIDENDSIYDKLRIWTKDAEGNDTLFALGEKGIGAIYLGSAASLFSLKDSQNSLLGQVQSTGIFIGENEVAGTVQQIDLVA